MQIRAGTGGDEAALFAADLLRMYQRYADMQNWKVSHLSESAGETGGLKEIIVQVGSGWQGAAGRAPSAHPCMHARATKMA